MAIKEMPLECKEALVRTRTEKQMICSSCGKQAATTIDCPQCGSELCLACAKNNRWNCPECHKRF